MLQALQQVLLNMPCVTVWKGTAGVSARLWRGHCHGDRQPLAFVWLFPTSLSLHNLSGYSTDEAEDIGLNTDSHTAILWLRRTVVMSHFCFSSGAGRCPMSVSAQYESRYQTGLPLRSTDKELPSALPPPDLCSLPSEHKYLL